MNRLKLLTLTVLLGGAVSGTAQRLYTPDLRVGVKAGATFSEMAWSPTVRQGFTPGMTCGVIVRYAEEKHFGLIGELNFVQRGWAESFEPGTGLRYSRLFSYIELPVMTHIFFGNDRFRGFVNLGPQIGYQVGDRISSNFDYANTSSVAGFPTDRRTEQLTMKPGRKFDYGITAGIGGEARVAGRHSVVIEGRFYYGLSNVFPSKRTDTFGASRSMSINVTAAYLFDVK